MSKLKELAKKVLVQQEKVRQAEAELARIKKLRKLFQEKLVEGKKDD